MITGFLIIFNLIFGFIGQPDKNGNGKLDQFISTQNVLYDKQIVEKYIDFIPIFKYLNNYNTYEQAKIKAKVPHKNAISYGLTVYQRIYSFRYTYKNEKICQASVDSFLNCVGIMCSKIVRGQNGSAKIPTSIIIINKMDIIISEIECTQVDSKWDRYKKDLVDYFAEDSADIIETKCGGVFWTNKVKIKNGL